jgi:hypothetical protein
MRQNLTNKQPQGGALSSKKVKTANELKNETQILKLLKPAKRLLAPRYAQGKKKQQVDSNKFLIKVYIYI